MIKGEALNLSDDKWNCLLYKIEGIPITIGIYRNKNSISEKYEVCCLINNCSSSDMFSTFRKAAEYAIKHLKPVSKYIPDIMRVTALMSEEK